MIIALIFEVVALFAIACCISDLDLVEFDQPQQQKGFRYVGEANGDKAGVAVNSVGDINHDGISDIIIRAKSANGGGGFSYVMFGHNADFIFENIFLVDMISGPTTGFRVIGGGGDASTWSVAAAGDVNNDGIDDFMVGAPGEDVAYVIYGRDGATTTQGDIDLSTFTTSPATGFKIIMQNGVLGGWCVSLVKDINGDRIPDLIVTDVEFQDYRGRTYVIFGNHSREGDIHANTITEEGLGFRITGENQDDWSGNMAVSAGDVNGDGVGDFIIGAPFADIDIEDTNLGVVGITYVMFGRNTSAPGVEPFGNIHLGTFLSNSTNGYRIIGQSDGQRCGWAVAGIGDINQDGYDDIAVSTYGDDVIYIILGAVSWLYRDMILANWDITWSDLGFRLFGASEAVSSAGDVNGDGFPDILCAVTAIEVISGRPNSGVVYVVFGRVWEFPYQDIILSDVAASETTGFRIIGAYAAQRLGTAVSSAGDFNNDGYDDMMVSAANEFNGKGGVFIVFGAPSAPTSQPSTTPTSQPSMQPSIQPLSLPTVQPTAQPTSQPSNQPFGFPSSQPSMQPTMQPTTQPTRHDL